MLFATNKNKKNGIKDKPLRTESYNNYIDTRHKDNIINDKQVNNYCIPKNYYKQWKLNTK